MTDRCDCNNPRCPKSQGCQHCMCLMSPDFSPNSVISYAGPIYTVCCKCGYQVATGGRTAGGSYTWSVS